MMSIEIKRVQDDLNERTWRFLMFDHGQVVLNSFRQFSRPTKRHNFKVDRRYDRIDMRDNNMSLDEVPWDDDLVREVKEKILSMITVVKTK